jgi:hypothetical protein
MKFRNKHYFEIGMLPVFMLPVIAVTIVLTLWAGGIYERKYPAPPDFPEHLSGTFSPKDKLALYENRDTTDLAENDKAVFTFTGDTVLILEDGDPLKGPSDSFKVLYKTPQGNLQTIDLPEAELSKVPADTSEAVHQ